MISNEYLTQENADKSVERLLGVAKALGLPEIAKEVLDNKKFIIWSGASKPTSHHYGKFGLVVHTHEVYINAAALFFINQNLYGFNSKDQQELFLSILFHDYGKTYDYESVISIIGYGEYALPHEEWKPTDHKFKIHHITRSALFFSECAKKYNLDTDLTDRVLHNILSHHGRKEWGSPVQPKTKIAWILHLADSVSARLYDCDSKQKIEQK